ncbi:creatinine amidohydrolase [Paenibacillus tianmuensis]|uniref:Creatinine amidohydrolase n=1 Tax=Paenibacillus tianmuensis TaxID=624147 RepID=A0A1G4PMQ5_9BACL|nr:creatininase family protein [Paenibacillus tianmuensis]SCW33475.1 creatinine amidohydrolase [Paenibacillus tianmuensis]
MSCIDLKYLTSSEAGEVSKRPGAVGIIPVGALEQHGPHLPLVTDSALAEILTAKVAECFREPVIVTPTLTAGLSEHHADFPGTITLNPTSLGAVLDSYIDGLQHMGLKRICLLSFHGGNFTFLGEYAARSSEIRSELQIEAYTDFRRFLQVMYDAGLSAGLKLTPADSHAGSLETSLALHAMGEQWVRSFGTVSGYTEARPGWMETIQLHGVRAVSPNGVFGTPRGANAAAGKIILDALVNEVALWLKDKFGLNSIAAVQPPVN